MKSFFAALLALISFSSVGFTKEDKVLQISNKAIRLCGHSISWNSVVSGLSLKESDCLDAISPLDFSESEMIKSAQIIELTQERLVDLLKKSRSLCLSEVELRIPARVTFSREKVLNPETVQSWIEQQLTSHFEDKSHEIVRIQLPKLDCEKTTSLKWGSFRIEGLNQFRMLLTADDKNFGVNGEFRLYQEIPVLIRPMMANQRIEPKDVVLAKKEVTQIQSYVLKPEELYGRLLSFPLSNGEPIQYRQLKTENLVEKGQVVQIHYKNENFLLSASGLAEQNGSSGDSIKIKNIETQKIFSGVVVGKGLVEVQ